MACLEAASMTAPRHPQTGQFLAANPPNAVKVVVGAPRTGFVQLTEAGTHEVSPPSVPPVSGQPADLRTHGSEQEQIALKVGWQSPDAHAGPSYRP